MRAGIVQWTSLISEDTVVFRWYQETGGSMGGSSGDYGWGILCIHEQGDQLEGMWWYEGPAMRTGDPRAGLYYWSLRRLDGEEDDVSRARP
jgi:hypothetical protein